MSISKEIFGIERIEYKYDDDCLNKEIVGFNQCINLIDEYELSEEEIYTILIKAGSNKGWGYLDLAKAIKQNQSKIFVRKSK